MFICVKCFVNFFLSRFPLYLSSSLLFFLCFATDTGRNWWCILSEPHRGIADFLRANWVWIGLCGAGWVGSLTVKTWTYGGCVLGCIRQRMPWVGLLTLAWSLTPYRLQASLRPSKLKHLIVLAVRRVWFFRVLRRVENAEFTARGRYGLCDCSKHVLCTDSQTKAMHTDGDSLPRSVCMAGVNSGCIFDSQTSTEKLSHVLVR